METAHIGCDPGKSGCIAVLLPNGTAKVCKLSETEADIRDFVSRISDLCFLENWPMFAYVERVSAMPKQGVSSTFKFGASYGFLRGLLVALKIPFEEVTPGTWQRALKCLSGGDKNVTKARAQQLFPAMTITHAIADGLLIAEYGRRVSRISTAAAAAGE